MNDSSRAVVVGIITLTVLAATVVAAGSVDAASASTGAGDVGPQDSLAPAAAADRSPSCSFYKTDTNLAYEGSTAGVLDPRTDDRLPVLLGGFTDTQPTYDAEDFEEAYFGTGTGNVNGTGTLRDYYLEATDGMINLSAGPAGVSGWYETDVESDRILSSDKDTLDLNPRENSQFVRKVIEQADSDIDFSDYDNNNDGCIAVMVVYQGVDMRAHAGEAWGNFFEDGNFEVEVDGVTVTAYARVKEMYTNGSGVQTGEREPVGTPAHELGHLYGLPDLYDDDGTDDIGPWGLMSTGNYGYKNDTRLIGSSPVHPTAWTKLLLLQHPSPEIDTLDPYLATIPRSGRPGILPPATQNQYYRINPRSVPGCSACDDQYYLLAYRALTGFEEGLGPWSSYNSSLRISRIDGPWDKDLFNDPSLVHGENRLNHYGNESFNASMSSLARLADGSQSGLDLRNFSTEYGMATFNDPPERHLGADERAVFAIPVGQTLPDGTQVESAHDIDHRVATDTSANMTVGMLPGTGDYDDSRGFEYETGKQFARLDGEARSLRSYAPGVKVVHETNQSTDYISATTYQMYSLPSAMEIDTPGIFEAIRDGDATTTIDVTVTAAGEPYDYGQFEPPTADEFDVEIGGVSIDSADVIITEGTTGSYDLEVTVPESDLEGHTVTVEFAESKGGIEHHVTDSESMYQPILDEMAGDGTASDPYQIRLIEQLQALAADHDATAELIADINAAETAGWFGNTGFVPIGNNSARDPVGVNVSLEGNRHTITDLNVDSWTVSSSGVFAGLGADSDVRNVTFVNATVSVIGSAGGVGTLAGVNRGYVDGVRVRDGTVNTTTATTGGVVGRNTGTVIRSLMTGLVTGDSVTGGLVGESTGTVTHSYANVTVIGGGVGASTGGLIGSLETEPRRATPALLTHSFAVAGVTATSDVGGLVGTNFNGTIENIFSHGSVTGERRVGSLVGQTRRGDGGGTVSHTYTTAQVHAEGNNGNIWGQRSPTAAYWSADIEAVAYGVNSTMLEPANMRGAAAETNMSELDFEDTWTTVEGDYPQLQWYVDSGEAVTMATSGTISGDLNGTVTDDGGESNDSSSDAGTTPGANGPGMGVFVAMLALALVAAGLARRERR
jgi:M6 family metalloprotease-like protein